MQVSIQGEHFEEAARLRDEVRILSSKLEGGASDGS